MARPPIHPGEILAEELAFLGQGRRPLLGEDLPGDRAVRLGMIRPAMPGLDPQAPQPGFQAGDAAESGRPPGTPVVAEDGLRQPVVAEDRGQGRLDGGALLIGTGRQNQREAGVVIAQAPGMNPALPQRLVPQEIHLPQRVGFGGREAAHHALAWGVPAARRGAAHP